MQLTANCYSIAFVSVYKFIEYFMSLIFAELWTFAVIILTVSSMKNKRISPNNYNIKVEKENGTDIT